MARTARRTIQESVELAAAPAEPPIEEEPEQQTEVEPSTPPPTKIGRPKRKPKAPKGHIAEQKKYNKVVVISSSLPPSSPPPRASESSQHLPKTPPRRRQPLQTLEEHDKEATLEQVEVGNADDGGYDDYDESGGNPFNVVTNSDPFGFMDVERKLTREMEMKPVIRKMPRRTFIPSPPHKQVLAKRVAPPSPSDSNHSPLRLSTPSPTKQPSRSSMRTRSRVTLEPMASVHHSDDDGEDKENVQEAIPEVKQRKRPRRSGKPVDPEALDLSLRALLPKKVAPNKAAVKRFAGGKAKARETKEVGRRAPKGSNSKKTYSSRKAREEDVEEIDVEADSVRFDFALKYFQNG
jgi:hypothetical protein